MEEEVKQSRLDTETLKELGEEQVKKEAEERKFRTEQAQKRKEEAKQREIEEVSNTVTNIMIILIRANIKLRYIVIITINCNNKVDYSEHSPCKLSPYT